MFKVMVCFFILGLMVIGIAARFTIAVPQLEQSCLFARYFLVDRKDLSIKRDHLLAFHLPVDTPYFKAKTSWIKKVVGMPNDTISIFIDGVKVNEKFYRHNMNQMLIKMNEKQPDRFFKTFKLAKDEYFVMGETPMSYDSRYWGTITNKDVIGHAYALF